MIVRLKQHGELPSALKAGQLYSVIGIAADAFRILSDHGKPYLYSRDLFEVVDPQEPQDWVTEIGAEGERYAYPSALNRPGFFEVFLTVTPKRSPSSGMW